MLERRSFADAALAATFRSGGTLEAAITGEPDSLDPTKATVYAAAQVYDLVFSKLIDMDSAGRFIPRLAKDWAPKGARTWVFDLRGDAYFHNGEKFTSDDVKYTFDRILNPKVAATFSSNFSSIERIRVLSPTRVEFDLKESNGPFLTNLAANGQIVNRRAFTSSNPALHPVGTGPFQFVDWVHGSRISLRRFNRYWERGEPFLTAVKVNFAPNSASRVVALHSGTLNWVDAVPPQLLEQVNADASLKHLISNTAGYPELFFFNCTQPPFNNKLVRQAVALAIDRKAIREIAYFGAGQVGSIEMPTGSPWYDPTDPYRNGPNIPLAKQKLAEAGAGSVSFEFLAWGAGETTVPTKVGELIQSQLAQIGVNVTVKPLASSDWIARLFKKDYQMTPVFNERTIDPDNIYSLYVASNAPENLMGYSNPTVDKLVAEARAETNMTKRKALYRKLRQQLFDDVPLFFYHYNTFEYVMRKNVSGSTSNPTLELRFQQVKLT